MRKKVKIVDATGLTVAQIETGINNALTKGWELVQIVVVSSKTLVIMQKQVVA